MDDDKIKETENFIHKKYLLPDLYIYSAYVYNDQCLQSEPLLWILTLTQNKISQSNVLSSLVCLF